MLSRRRMLMSTLENPEGGLVMDGLIVNLDGTQMGDIDGVWKDLQGNADFNYEKCVKLSNGLSCLGGSIFNKDNILFPTTGTVEIVFRSEYDYTQPQYIFMSNSAVKQVFTMGVAQPYGLIIGSAVRPHAPAFDFKFQKQENLQLSVTTDYAIANSTDLKRLPNTYFSDSRDSWIGSYYGGGSQLNSVYAFRYYNRKLTREEILQNQEYDKIKYFGGA